MASGLEVSLVALLIPTKGPDVKVLSSLGGECRMGALNPPLPGESDEASGTIWPGKFGVGGAMSSCSPPPG